MTTARGIPTAAHSSHSILVRPSTPSVAETAKRAASAARSPALRSPVKSAYPGVSSRFTLTPECVSGATVRLTERCCLISTSSKSLTVVPSSTRPIRWMVPVALSSASTRVVLPEPEWPTSTTLRTPPGWSAGAAPPVAVDPLLSVIIASCWSVRLLLPVACSRLFGRCHRLIALRSAFTPWLPHHKPPARIARPAPAPQGMSRGVHAGWRSAGYALGWDGHAERAAACPVPRADPGRRRPGAHAGDTQRADDHRHRRGDRGRAVAVSHGPPVRRDLGVHGFRPDRHARRHAGPGQGDQRRVGRVPRLHPGPDQRRGRLRWPHHLAGQEWAGSAGLGSTVLPGHGDDGVVCEGAGRGAGHRLQRGYRGAHRAAPDHPGRGRADRARRAVRARHRVLGARGPVADYLRPAGGCGPARDGWPAGIPGTGRGFVAGSWW